jgi:two-component system sensor histidine kinase GlrK
MRSPLASLREALGLLRDGTCGPLGDRQKRVVELASRACEREVRIVEALLDLSRLRSGMPLRREAGCDIDRVLEAAVTDEKDDSDKRGVRIELELGGSAPGIGLDSVLVERAVANLVRNAVSVSDNGKRVRVTRALETDGDGDSRSIVVHVSDEGPGIDPRTRAFLFTPFATAPVPGVARAPGIGIGLSFAREVARAHGGDLTLVRSDATGTTFALTLPFVREETP